MFDEADVLSDLDQLRSRYEILRRLGVNGSAPVYAARLRATGQHFAVKVMADRASRAKSPGALHGWQAHNVEPLVHPKLMTMHAVHHLQGGAVAIAVERRRGRTLAERMRDERLSLDEIEAVLRDVGEALAYLHGRGVVHRGVRPESIFLDRDAGCARLAHFGMEVEAYAVSAGPEVDAASGFAQPALRYLAPEQLKNGIAVAGPRVSPATDLFSLGVTGWALLTGYHPADAAGDSDGTSAAWRKRLAGRLAEACPSAPLHLIAAIDGCLEPKPGRRVANGSEFVGRLEPGDTAKVHNHGPEEAPRLPGESRDPALSASSPSSRGSQLVASLSRLGAAAIQEARRPSSSLSMSLGSNQVWARRETDASEPAVAAAGIPRVPLKVLALPTMAILLLASALVARQLSSDDSSAGNGDGPAKPASVQSGPARAEAAGLNQSAFEADLDILDDPGTSSYRVRLQPDPRSRVTSDRNTPRTASRQESPAPQGGTTPPADIPTSRLQDQGAVAAGFVLLGEPIRR